MCFDAARDAGWVGTKRLDHIGFGTAHFSPISITAPSFPHFYISTLFFDTSTLFRPVGVICGPDGKRFKSRSGETVRLVDLLDASVRPLLPRLIATDDTIFSLEAVLSLLLCDSHHSLFRNCQS
jgi:hypothetical protein